jgi:hypothetical protein
MESNSHSLDDIISSLNMLREQMESGVQASTPNGLDNTTHSGPTDEETASQALEEYLASRLQQIGEVSSESKEIKGLKTGNGWDPSQVIEHVFKIDPVSMKRAFEVALSSNKSIKERLANLFRTQREETKIIGMPTIEFLPIWKIKGYHECYYLRSNTYKVGVKEDVVGVEVEGRSRDLILEKKHRRFVPSVLLQRLQMLSAYLTSESKYFVVGDVLELAVKKSESELTMTGLGKAIGTDEEMEVTSWRSKRIFDLSELRVRGAKVQVRECTVTKEALLTKFREQVIQMPDRFKQILSNRLQISELKRIYIPFIRIPVQKGLVPRDIVINGTNGELADNDLMTLIE